MPKAKSPPNVNKNIKNVYVIFYANKDHLISVKIAYNHKISEKKNYNLLIDKAIDAVMQIDEDAVFEEVEMTVLAMIVGVIGSSKSILKKVGDNLIYDFRNN